MTLRYDLPRVGRLRVFDPVGPKRTLWRCRLCGRAFKTDNIWRHFGMEAGDHPDGFEKAIALAMLRRRNRRNRKNAQRAYMDDPAWHDRNRKAAKERKP